MPPPLRNGIYAAYSAAFSRMLSDSTPGRATLRRVRPELPCVPPSSAKQFPIVDEERLGDETRLQRMHDQRALPRQRPMIAKQRERRHHRPASAASVAAKSGLRSGAPPAATRARSAVHAPSQSMARREPLLALLLAARRPGARPAPPATGSSAWPTPVSQAARSPCHAGSAMASASSGAPPACASTAAGAATPWSASHPPRRRHRRRERRNAGSGCATSPARGPAGARPGADTCRGGGSSSVFSSAFAAAAFIVSAGTMIGDLGARRDGW